MTPPAPGRTSRLSDRWLAVAFISPALILLLGMSVFPLLWALYLSFTDYSATRDVPASFVGLQNYADLLWASPRYAPRVHQAALNTFWVMLSVPVLTVVVSFPLAVMLNSVRRLRTLLPEAQLRALRVDEHREGSRLADPGERHDDLRAGLLRLGERLLHARDADVRDPLRGHLRRPLVAHAAAAARAFEGFRIDARPAHLGHVLQLPVEDALVELLRCLAVTSREIDVNERVSHGAEC